MQVDTGTMRGATAALAAAGAAPSSAGAGGAARAGGARGVTPSPAAARGAGTSAAGQVLRDFGRAAAERHAEVLGDLLGRLVRALVTGEAGGATRPAGAATARSAKAATKPASGATKAPAGALAFLQDPRLSVEEKLARLMIYLSDKYEKQLEKKLQQYAELEQGKGTPKARGTGAGASGGGSFLDGLKSVVSKAFPGIAAMGGVLDTVLPGIARQVAGPVLAGAATALGLPALAPVLLAAGPAVGSAAGGAVSAVLGGSAGAASGAGSTGTSAKATNSSSTGDLPSEKQIMTEIQILQEKQKEMFALVSNILRSMHDTKMAVIGNIR